NAFPVVENGKLTGFVTKFDFLKAFQFTTSQLVPHYDELMRKTVRDVMSTNIVSVTIEQPLTRALQLMIETRARSFPVVNAQGGL
ncbi:CBS domain-containing protein, partial [Acinetobacter baumannii]